MSKTLLICALVLSSCSCIKNHQADTQGKVFPVDVPIHFGFNPFVLDIENDNSFGRAFIANGYMWSAEHIFAIPGVDTPAEKDLKCIGPAPIQGLEICKEVHTLKDIFYYRTPNAIKYLVDSEDHEKFYLTSDLNPIVHGDSGIPVFCLEHNKVIGVVSHFIGDGYYGQITKLTLSDVPKLIIPSSNK